MPNDDHDWITTDADLQPGQAQTDDEKINVLLDLLASGFENDPDLDLVRDSALHHLLQFPRLPDRTIQIMLSILGDKDESALVLRRKMVALDVLAHMGIHAADLLGEIGNSNLP